MVPGCLPRFRDGLFSIVVFSICFLILAQRPLTAQNKKPPGESTQTIKVGSVQRSFIRYIPKGYDGSAAVPLVIVLHGRGGTAQQIENLTGFSTKADAENFIVVYPQAIGSPTVWNTGFTAVSANGADDMSFIREMLDRLQHNFKIDPKRVYICGFSSGAIMSYYVGAQMSNRIAAMGIAAGFTGVKQPDGSLKQDPTPAGPVSAIVFHGKNDTTIFYTGGGSLVDCVSVADSIAFWVHADSCNARPHQTTKQNGNLIIDDYTQCSAGSEIILRTFVNGTHEWPKMANNDHFDATDAVWDFFAAHPKP
ncbi:MAG: PHB depolymerase family esterase [Acidobacteriota bacterium]